MDIDFLGPMLSDDVATAIAVGDMDPISMLVFSTDGRSPSQPPRQGFAALPPRQQPQLLDPRMFSRYAASNGSAPGKPNSTSTSRASPPWKRKFPRSFGAQPRTGLLGAFKSSGSTPAPSNVEAHRRSAASSPQIPRRCRPRTNWRRRAARPASSRARWIPSKAKTQSTSMSPRASHSSRRRRKRSALQYPCLSQPRKRRRTLRHRPPRVRDQ